MSPLLIDSPHLAHVWRAGELASNSLQTVATGYAALDSVLPGGGWPLASLTELLQPQAGLYEWGLLLPALAAMQKTQARAWTVLVGAPHAPFAPSLAAQALDMQRLLRIHAEKNDAPALLWATREALQCADVGAVVAWLPDARSAHLRRLQIAAQTHNKLLFVFRLQRAQHESSPAPLRLLLQAANHGLNSSVNMGHLLVDVFKRRGPPLATPVLLDTRPQRLAAFLAASQKPSHRQSLPAPYIDFSDLLRKPLHALDRVTSLIH